jgi:hypothetical protein
MKKEYMLRILNNGDNKAGLSPEGLAAFLKACEAYIANLKANGQLIAAQPLLWEGVTITGTPGNFTEVAFDAGKQVQVGYYHILANDINEAVEIAKNNPEFAFGTKAAIEVRPIKMREISTGFEYPKS